LLKKDWGLNCVPIYGGLVLVASPYLVAALAAMTARGPLRGREVSQSFMVAAVMADVLTILLAAVFGAAAFALERRERSADFLAMMPVSRMCVVASKLVLASVVLAALWLSNCAIYSIACHYGHFPPSSVNVIGDMLIASILLFTLFGVAWLFSSFLSSPPIAAFISIGVGCAAFFWPELLPNSNSVPEGDNDTLLFLVFIIFGLLGVVIGTFHYLRRVEP
jgi:hypothetical protein